MPSYLLLLHGNVDRPKPSSPDEYMSMMKTYMAWTDRIRREGHHQGGQKLTDDAGKILRNTGGRVSITDGPYAESKEVLGGYYLITARDYEEACKVAATSPHLGFGGRIEVRQIHEL